MQLRLLIALTTVLSGCVGTFIEGDISNHTPGTHTPSEQALDGVALYGTNCAGCHNPLPMTAKRRAKAERITLAISLVPDMGHLDALTQPEIAAIAEALSKVKPVVQPACATAPDVGTVAMHRLNQAEYRNTIRAVTGVELTADPTFPTEEVSEFPNNAQLLSMNTIHLRWYLDTAGQVADQVFSRSELRSRLFTCTLSQSSCWQPALTRLAERVYRRPATTAELDRLKARFAELQIARDATTAFKTVMQAMLLSPQFLFRNVEGGDSAAAKPLTDYELASRMSYFLWGESPDDALYQAAAQSRLRDATVLGAQVDRMLADPRAGNHLGPHFFSYWLHLNDLPKKTPDATRFPQFTPVLQSDMGTESQLVLADIVRNARPLSSILNLDFTYANQPLAQYYGLPWPGGTGFQKVSLAGTVRSGVLTHGSLLTVTSHSTGTSIVRRGSFVSNALECTPLGTPPAGTSTTLPPPNGTSIRDRLEAHRNDPRCSSCHAVMDPPGFGLESFNAVGQHRTLDDDGFALDTGGELSTGKLFTNARELAAALSEGEEFKRCSTQKLMTFALGRELEEVDACTVQHIVNQNPSASLRDTVLGIIQSDLFQQERGG